MLNHQATADGRTAAPAASSQSASTTRDAAMPLAAALLPFSAPAADASSDNSGSPSAGAPTASRNETTAVWPLSLAPCAGVGAPCAARTMRKTEHTAG